ncbi:DUF5412 domain-containing protein [Rossellomorea sp. AcN35-11]|nr:DUF5412 domain-containing protein [Rossellomorea sp. AcN35-11]
MSKHFSNFFRDNPVSMSLGIGSVILISVCCYFVYWAFFDIQRLQPGELITDEVSPDGSYTVKTYLGNGGATVNYAVLGVLYFNNKENEPKHIYWDYEEQEGKIRWVDKDTVIINDVKLNVPEDTYDYRHQ